MKKYVSLVLFAHSIFALPFAIIGFTLGFSTPNDTHEFSWIKLLLVVLCMVFARNAAMAFNRYLDRNIDKKNPRTIHRDIPAGRVQAREALIFVGINCLLFIATTYFINFNCLVLSPVALFVVLFYSYTKRFTALCHLVLGLGLSLAPIGAYIAVTNQFATVPIIFSLVVLFWVSGFDIIYALQDDEFDKNENLHSIPALMGRKNALRTSEFLHLLSAICVVAPIFFTALSWAYYLGVVFFWSMLIYQHRLVKPHDLSKVNQAFGTTNGIASVIFAMCFLLDTWLRSL